VFDDVDTPFEVLGWALTFSIAIVLVAFAVGIAIAILKSMLRYTGRKDDS
jgi:flagellar biosynthesis protein FliQ